MRFITVVFAALFTFVQADQNKGINMHGFNLIEKRFVQEVDAECYLFEHEKSGARLLKILNSDNNKTFCISFKTITESDAGTPHILEHSVLNGSKNFPVKSPFDILSKGSLNTFLNAMTGSDITLYPVSSMNDKDFKTLMHIYLDAVFNPLIYNDPRILEQEGWHHELEHADSSVSYKGVVYNEMKGAFSSPTREWGFWVDKYLFPDTPYQFSSGGYPKAIPTLTHEAFLNFHRKYYHPSNSYIFLYGDGDLDSELAFIDQEYLSGYERPENLVKMPMQASFDAMKIASGIYAAAEGTAETGESYLSLSFVAGLSSDPQLTMALRLLSQTLINNESAPVRLALQEAGIGKDVSAWVDDLQQNVFHIRIQNANPDQADVFKQTVFDALERVMTEGLDPAAVAGSLNRMEFGLREGNTPQKGLYYNNQALSTWFWTDDPFPGLGYETPLAELKSAIKDGYLESLVRTYFLENTHSLLFTLNPKVGLESQNDRERDDELAAYKSSLSQAEIQALVNHTEELIAYQKADDSPEALATIPLLDLKDINPEVDWYEISEKRTFGASFLHFDTFTNNISYLQFLFDLKVLTAEELPYAQILAVLLGSIGTENYSFGELDNILDSELGGFSTYLSTYLESQNDDLMLPVFVVSTKTLSAQQDRAFALTQEILNRSLLTDSERIKDVLVRHQSRLSANVKRDGLGYARTRLFSYLTDEGMFNELTGGLEYYWFVNDLVENFDAREAELLETLQRISRKLFTRSNLTSSVTCDTEGLKDYKPELRKFRRQLSPSKPSVMNWVFAPSTKNEGLLAASKVQYVLQGSDFKSLGYAWNGKFLVLNQILSREWLRNQVRVIGGAYGGFSRISPSGTIFFGSYRDPNLSETLKNYRDTPGFLHDFEVDSKEMTRYIIGTISGMDRPLTPSQKGSVALRRYLEKTTRAQLQADRTAVLNTSAQDIKQFESFIQDVLSSSRVCVYGNEDKLNENKELFDDLIKL